MKFIFITNNSSVAYKMASAGVHRIMVDLEINGKQERQGHLDTVISKHTLHDVDTLRKVLNDCPNSELMVRINPIFSGSKAEIDEAISRGADRIMLPMFTHQDEVAQCLDLLRGRVPLTLLLETAAGLARLPNILLLGGFDDIHIGLNDLHIDLGLDFMFELFSSGLLDCAANLINDHNIAFGIGGVACIGTGVLPAELILASHMQLGSQRVILSRSFLRSIDPSSSVEAEISKINSYICRGDLDLTCLRRQLNHKAVEIANAKRLESQS